MPGLTLIQELSLLEEHIFQVERQMTQLSHEKDLAHWTETRSIIKRFDGLFTQRNNLRSQILFIKAIIASRNLANEDLMTPQRSSINDVD